MFAESLPEASEAQLDRLDDVCAICYQEMKTAKITRCNHYFHGVCLRKWLYVQVNCSGTRGLQRRSTDRIILFNNKTYLLLCNYILHNLMHVYHYVIKIFTY